jgi:MoaA/NifB/PqqE/SkfB family radical SAM enzyme
MDYGLFKKIIDECSVSGVYSVRLSIRGEPLLHPQIMDFIRYSKGKGIREVSFLTNALLLDDKISVDLIESGLDWMTVSFDGLGSTYEKIRRPAKYEEALNRLKAFSNMRRRKKSTKPALKVQAIWPAIEDDPEGFNKVFSGIADMVSFNPLVAFGSCPEQREDYICPAVWQRLVIYWDGAVPQCINDPFGDNIVGDIRKEAIREVWLGAGMKEVRDKILRGNRLSLVPCSVCYYGAKKDMMTIKMAHGKILAGMVSANLSRHGDYKGGGDG